MSRSPACGYTGLQVLSEFLCPTLGGQRVVADDGDAEALAVLLGQRNLVDLVSLQVGLKHR